MHPLYLYTEATLNAVSTSPIGKLIKHIPILINDSIVRIKIFRADPLL